MRRFSPGDIVHVVREPSRSWIQRGPVKIASYWSHRDDVVELVHIDYGTPVAIDGFGSYALEADCEPCVFLAAARKAIRDAG